MHASRRKRLVNPIKLSVLMPLYNERYLVRRAVALALAFEHPLVAEVELVVVDDGSTDGSLDVLQELAEQDPRIHLVAQSPNQGKGAAVRRAIAEATGELCVIHDSDLEYDPRDWAQLLRPFIEADADAVYGSRFLSAEYRRVLYYRHQLGNRLITGLSNLATDLNLTDVETCSKMVRTQLLKSIPIRSNDFGIEPELTAKLATRGAVIYEVPIRYAGRTYREGKKTASIDGAKALWSILKWKLIDDAYDEDDYGADILSSLSYVRRLHAWMADSFTDHVGSRVLEIGAGIGNLTMQLIPRGRYLATDINPHYLAYLQNLSLNRPYLEVSRLDLLDSESFAPLGGQFDTVLCINVLEHVRDEQQALENLHQALAPGGKAVVLVPQGQWLFSSLDDALEHRKRYSKADLTKALTRAGFDVLSVYDYNRVAVPGWLLNGKLLRRKHFSRVQLKFYNTMTPLFRAFDSNLPWHGLSAVAIGQRRE